MTALVWDQVSERRYETGIDRGVLYLPDGGAVSWNGLTSVVETLGREVKTYYSDGVQYLAHHVPGSYNAKLQAYTYPDELDELLGISEYAPGVFLHDQRARLFDLAYRTRVGNDVDPNYGYKIHILYNIMATPSDRTYNSLSDSVSLSPFEWSLTGTPAQMFGLRPTSHISLSSTSIDPSMLELIEQLIYGTDVDEPTLPNLIDLLNLVAPS